MSVKSPYAGKPVSEWKKITESLITQLSQQHDRA